jgi:hypothetical protein
MLDAAPASPFGIDVHVDRVVGITTMYWIPNKLVQIAVSEWQVSSKTLKMSDLYRSAISARIARLPDLPHGDDDDDDLREDAADSLGSLPGSGMGPPAMQVQIYYNDFGAVVFNHKLLKGLPSTAGNNPIVHPIQTFPPYPPRLSLLKPSKLMSLPGN